MTYDFIYIMRLASDELAFQTPTQLGLENSVHVRLLRDSN